MYYTIPRSICHYPLREVSGEGEFELEFEFESGLYLFFIPRGICH